MEYSIKEKISNLLNEVSNMEEIKAIGQTGDINAIPKPGESDIDIFVFGDNIPDKECRKLVYDRVNSLYEEVRINVCEGGVWGTGDVFIIDGVETMLMYFTIDETMNYVNEVLVGKHLDSVKGFYPVGRCSTLIKINILYDEIGMLSSLKEKLSVYPNELRKSQVCFHLDMTNDEEDFGRALMRKDVLFYHQVLEVAIDHYLQALYAANNTFFPSRKRTQKYMEAFKYIPQNCYERMLNVVRLGSEAEGIEKSYYEWCKLVNDLKDICNSLVHK